MIYKKTILVLLLLCIYSLSLLSSENNNNKVAAVDSKELEEKKNKRTWIDNPVVGTASLALMAYGSYKLFSHNKAAIQDSSNQLSNLIKHPAFEVSSNLEKVIKIGALLTVSKSLLMVSAYLYSFAKRPKSMIKYIYENIKKPLSDPVEVAAKEKEKKDLEKELSKEQLKYYKKQNEKEIL